MTYDDPPITKDELLRLQLIRIGKEPSKAQRSEYYNKAAPYRFKNEGDRDVNQSEEAGYSASPLRKTRST